MSSGLVRRTNAAKSSNEFNGSSTSTQNDVNDNLNGNEEESHEETSDKETRLTLMEEVLLLGLKDKEVND